MGIRSCFLVLESILFFIFMYLDIVNLYPFGSDCIKLFSIFICFLYVIIDIILKRIQERGIIEDYIIPMGLCFTFLSDIQLLIFHNYSYGVISFVIVQILYLVKLRKWKKKKINIKSVLKKILSNIVSSLFVLIVIYFYGIKIDLLLVVSCYYFISICFNVKDAILINVRNKTIETKWFAYGMTLFLLCDINVGIFNLYQYLEIGGQVFFEIYKFSTIGMWLFYLPAQVCISLSFVMENKRIEIKE